MVFTPKLDSFSSAIAFFMRRSARYSPKLFPRHSLHFRDKCRFEMSSILLIVSSERSGSAYEREIFSRARWMRGEAGRNGEATGITLQYWFWNWPSRISRLLTKTARSCGDACSGGNAR